MIDLSIPPSHPSDLHLHLHFESWKVYLHFPRLRQDEKRKYAKKKGRGWKRVFCLQQSRFNGARRLDKVGKRGREVSQDLLTSRDPNNVSAAWTIGASAGGWIIRRTEIKGKGPTVFLISAIPSFRASLFFDRRSIVLGVQISSFSPPLFFFLNSRFYYTNIDEITRSFQNMSILLVSLAFLGKILVFQIN